MIKQTGLFPPIEDMENFLHRSISQPIRNKLTVEKRRHGIDKGLINSWEVGRKMAKSSPEIAEKAKKGELPPDDYKGGVRNNIKIKVIYGSYHYLAQWQ